MEANDCSKGTAMKIENISNLKKMGFDETYYDKEDIAYVVICSQCEALVINNVPCHEIGCPNQPERASQ